MQSVISVMRSEESRTHDLALLRDRERKDTHEAKGQPNITDTADIRYHALDTGG